MYKEIESNLSKQMQQVVNRLFRKFCYSIYFAVLFFINGLLLSECRAGLRADIEKDKRSYFKSRINHRENEATFFVSSHDSNTKKMWEKIQMFCLDIPFFPITCLISQVDKKWNNFTSVFSTTVNGFDWNWSAITELQCCLGWFHGSTLMRISPVSLLVSRCLSDVFSGDYTRSDLELNSFLRLFKSAPRAGENWMKSQAA